ncbi:SO2930 family diheme c-type cytochrome [Marinigracilibium pacificum]|uniref:Uncharacterized protein n=1 Tax=Marinigracilibium pacificum TaxID=2729599 RepID=A0A848IYY4_9BACT|nr:SO2930 family diheme c-type cytochrome [Marinigracilibium pacificum]NMM47209.1 hypothetical protein [Marinigracilibium pacificum]
MRNFVAIILTSIFLFWGCSDKKAVDRSKTEDFSPEPELIETYGLGNAWLSEYGFFSGDLKELIPAENVYSYEINTPLFSDYAIKRRFIYLPEGSSMHFVSNDVLNFPVGTVLIKNFYYEELNSKGNKIIETRLLIRNEDDWKPLTYIWKNDQTDAYLEIVGAKKQVSFYSPEGKKLDIKYSIPDLNQCQNCHNKNEVLTPIGPTAAQLNKIVNIKGEKVNQLVAFASNGNLKDMPSLEHVSVIAKWDSPEYSISERARAYLDINCGHCHNPGGSAKTSGLNLTLTEKDPHKLGIDKKPVAAGKASGNLLYDIVKGKPEQSIVLFRMNSDKPEIMMPELGRSLIHQEGVELIKAWIKEMD